MAFLLYFGSGMVTIGVVGVIASIVSPDRGGVGTILLGIVFACVGVAALVLARRRGSRGH